MYKICFFVPVDYADAVKAALFSAGAGKIGNYDQCCWQTAGQGQFRALAQSQPFIGKQGQLEITEEYKVELVCAEALIKPAITALKNSHPYEEPAYEVYKLEDF
ncbi:MAG: NGG1p interacting factor NIF3 [Gammaproteobacteria bacterium]|nr:NGG1p interacting factor NIF3 [Gammaproteobacteria bacterium]